MIKKTLHLNLKKKWFDMILSGEKIQEYREIKDYWILRLFINYREYFTVQKNNGIQTSPHHQTITFSNGYSKNRPQFEIELDSIEIGKGYESWGAEKDKDYFILNLGDMVNENL